MMNNRVFYISVLFAVFIFAGTVFPQDTKDEKFKKEQNIFLPAVIRKPWNSGSKYIIQAIVPHNWITISVMRILS